MSAERDGEGFLSRWSRRKLEAKAQPAPAPDAAAESTPAAPDPPPPELPPIESLDAASDYTAFLQRGVSAEMQRLALQRAWASDPAIAGFRGMADYDWDFNAPGYGALAQVDDVAKLLTQVLGGEEKAEEAPPAAEPVAAVASSVRVTEASPPEPEPEPVPEAEAEPEEVKPAAPRRHGSAMPSFEGGGSQVS